jgi:hypothetical protein
VLEPVACLLISIASDNTIVRAEVIIRYIIKAFIFKVPL